MSRLWQASLVGVLMCAVVSVAGAQQTPQPVVRTGNFFEVGNDLFMHIIATADIRYKTAHNLDFESDVRDRATSRNPSSTAQHETEGDLSYAELRFGVDARYQKNLTFQLMFENQSVFDGNLIDDRSNTSNPGGTDVFGRGTSTENPGFRVERYWIRYKFPGTPLLLHVGADFHTWSQAGILANDNPRIGLEAEFGDLQLWASAVIEREAQRLGLQNDNDSIYYVFGGGYNLKPHRFQLDVVYFRDRFGGADTQTVGFRSGLGWTGQRVDSVWIAPSWTGTLGPVRALLQGNLLVGTARGATAGLPGGVPARRDYDIFAGGVVAYAEANLGIVRPFVGFMYGSGDGDARDDKLHGFAVQPVSDSTAFAVGLMGHLDRSSALGGARDYSCPGRFQGLRGTAPANNPYAIGTAVTAASTGGGFAECSHTVANLWNERLGQQSHVGIVVTYSNPGTLTFPVGLRVFPVKGHEITGWYVYRAMVDTGLLETAFAPELAGRSLSKTQVHEVGGFWMWTLNPHFDIRLAGTIGIAGEGTKDLARLADCNPRVAGVQSCDGDDVALRGEARFRARF
ncbi:MAG: hypothetical protein FJZ47_08060 [Candidatus Tectomicrobia bacterium]|uniref:Uncharacterized protein n=1 Tax=Tectimicrobiota bacterium TaxID=2528274 RepID=A0A937W202_UNCTE|nr:hypothetical protein [Candidatus Tectomicrobia bacterium]